MFETIQTIAGGLAVFFAALATGAAWAVTMAAPNCSFDRLDYSRADGHVRQLLRDASTPISGMLLAATAFAALAGSWGAAILSGLAAIGFFFNRWTLGAQKKGDKPPPGVRQRKKSQRVVAVGFSLMFAAVAAVAAILAVFGV